MASATVVADWWCSDRGGGGVVDISRDGGGGILVVVAFGRWWSVSGGRGRYVVVEVTVKCERNLLYFKIK